MRTTLILVVTLTAGMLRAEAPITLSGLPVEKAVWHVWELARPDETRTCLGAIDPARAETWRSSGKADSCVALREGTVPCIRIGGDPTRIGAAHGLSPAKPFAVEPGGRCLLSFEGFVRSCADTYVVYVRTYDAAGRDNTSSVAVPDGWGYSPHSKAFYLSALAFDAPSAWEKKEMPLTLPEGVAAVLPILAPWRGNGLLCRSLSLSGLPPVRRHEVVFGAPVRIDGTTMRFESANDSLRLDVKATPLAAEACQLEATLSDCAPSPRSRALRLVLDVPHELTGWTLHRDGRRDMAVTADGRLTLDTHTVGGHPVSAYPFTAVSREGRGFALGTPIGTCPYEGRTVSAKGIESTIPVGLLKRAAGGTSATYRWQLFAFRGDWGFRSAACVYYALQGDRLPRPRPGAKEGAWLWPTWPRDLPADADDFGLTFWEAPATVATHPGDIRLAHEKDIGVFPYTEAWGMRQQLATAADGTHPPVAARLAELKAWAATNAPGKTWFDAPRHIAAQAALNSLPVQPDGTHPFAVDRYDVWWQWWRTNADPRLSKPNRASLCWDYTIGRDPDAIDGIYLDSVGYGAVVNFKNVRREHLDVMDEPLVYDPETGRPCADGMQHQVAFVRWVADRFHAKGKRIFGNVFDIAYRFHATTIDIFGSECGSWGNNPNGEFFQSTLGDANACMKRFYACGRPVTDLLQESHWEKKAPLFTPEGMRCYVEHELFYGFYPGVSTVGGDTEASYARWKRYFDRNRQCERDRPLFKAVIPLIRRLNKAGWEPETLVRADSPDLWAERFGATPEETYVTVRNASGKPVTATLRSEFKTPVVGLTPLWGEQAEPSPVPGGWRVTVAPWRTFVYRVVYKN